ncbi:MAG: methenyltetrahydromethanopterin cyclohydrolase [Euryarchaeota archaeon]|nr:methenyltetrahydromethanopterin cyclohydrolase [Euryarchaeota archaeon]
MTVSVNYNAQTIVEDLIDFSSELNVNPIQLKNEAWVIDCGIKAKGGYRAGALFTEICMGGLGETRLTTMNFGEFSLPAIEVNTDFPDIALLGSQKAGWQIKVENFSAIGSGPARALALKPKKTFDKIDYKDDADVAILALETNQLPNEKVVEIIATQCNVKPENVYLIVAQTSSIVGSTQIAGRATETGMFKLCETLNFDPKKVKYAFGICPIAPINPDPFKAMGTSNDMIFYGSRTFYSVELNEKDNPEELVKKLPSISSKDYGKPFSEIFKNAGYDFYKIDTGLFAPAEVILNDIKTGATYKSGQINKHMLIFSLGLKIY